MGYPLRSADPFETLARQIDEREERPGVYCPRGFDAPAHSVEHSNYIQARIAAREARGRAIHCPVHRASLEAWKRGLTDWPWPKPTPEQVAAADAAVIGLLSDEQLVKLSADQRRYLRMSRGRGL